LLSKLRNIGFTKQDILVISFLLLAFIAGLIIKFVNWSPAPDYNYSESDKQFERSLKNSFDSLDAKLLTASQQEKLNKINSIKDSISSSDNIVKLSPKEVSLNRTINLNTAGIEELTLLPGIGKSTAEKIVEFRNSSGRFKRPEDIMNVKGIGEKKFAKLKEHITVE
jgi:comEA protein